MKKFFMIAVMTVVCMTASAQKMRHGAGQITVQPMIGLSSGYLRGEEETATGTVKYENNDSRTGLALGVEGEYYTTTPWLSVSAGLMYQVDFINIPVLANFYVAKGFALKIGLQPGFVVSADKGIKDDCNTFNLALPVGLSYEFKNGITLDLRGAAAITKLNKNGNNGGMLTIGYKFELK